MAADHTIQQARRLLEEIQSTLRSEREANWIRGISSALEALSQADSIHGYDMAKSIYRTMMESKCGFSDYYIKRADFAEQANVNRRFDEIRNKLWDLFQEG